MRCGRLTSSWGGSRARGDWGGRARGREKEKIKEKTTTTAHARSTMHFHTRDGLHTKIKAGPDLKQNKTKQTYHQHQQTPPHLDNRGKAEEQGQGKVTRTNSVSRKVCIYTILNRCTKFINGNIYPHFIFIHTYIHISIYIWLAFLFLSG